MTLSRVCSEQLSDFRADELDVIARQRLIGWQGKDARAQMLSDGKLAATHVYALRSRLQMDGGVVMHHVCTPGVTHGQVIPKII